MATTNYKNEGFLYIANGVGANANGVDTNGVGANANANGVDTNAVDANANAVDTNAVDTKPFTMGHIVDTYGNLICPGEIPILINPDMEMENQLSEIKFYTPLLRGIRVRIYWYVDGWELSTINEIYPIIDTETTAAINAQINADLLDKSQVYYATITKENTIILNYTTEKSAPELTLPQLDHDMAFTYHMPLIPFTLGNDVKKMMKTLEIEQDYGIILFKQDGSQIELWNKHYYIMKSMEKPDHVSIYTYYFQCLNKYAVEDEHEDNVEHEDNDFEIIMIHLLCDINEFTIYFPEHKEKCDSITKKIEEYITGDSYQKIDKLNYLLSLDIDYAISLISPMPSRRNSVV
jgi:hypothetical protein